AYRRAAETSEDAPPSEEKRLVLQRLAALEPDNREVHEALAVVCVALGDEPGEAEARAALMKLLTRAKAWDEVIGEARKVIKRRPDSAEAREELFHALKELERRAEAL